MEGKEVVLERKDLIGMLHRYLYKLMVLGEALLMNVGLI